MSAQTDKFDFFWTKFTQKGYFWSKTEKVKTTVESCIFELVFVPGLT